MNKLKKLELLGAAIILYIDSYFTLKESREKLDHYYQDTQDGISLDIRLFASEIELLKKSIVNYDEDEIRHSLKRFKYYLSKIENYLEVGVDAKKLSNQDLFNFAKALKEAIILCENTLKYF